MHGRRVGENAEIGGIYNIESIIDQQEGPTCGFEAVENTIQLYLSASNQLSRRELIRRAHVYGALQLDETGPTLDVTGYDKILRSFGIGATWNQFDHDLLIGAVWENRVAIALVDGHLLDRENYPIPDSWHAVLVTNVITDLSHRTALGYVGVDSNFAGQQRWWSLPALERATRAYGEVTLLITDTPVLWPHNSAHFVRLPDNRLVPAR